MTISNLASGPLALTMLGVLMNFAAPAFAQRTLTGSVILDGTITGTGSGPLNHATNYDDEYTVTVNYKITFNKDGSVDYSPDKTYVILQGVGKHNKDRQRTNSIAITKVTISPAGKVTNIKFAGDNWYPNPGPENVGENSASGSIDIDPNTRKGTGTVEAKYTHTDGKSTSGYSFTTDSTQQPGAAKESKGTSGAPFVESVDSRINDSKSIDYDPTTGLLSILEDSIITTPGAPDPLLNANVTFPEFQFEGFAGGGKAGIFWAVGDTPYTVSEGGNIFQQSDIPILYYDTANNLFYAPLSDTTLAGMSPGSPFYSSNLSDASSPFLNFISGVLDPSSPGFDPSADLYLTISPDVNYLALTNSFTAAGDVGGYDMEFAADPSPEPSSLVLLGLGTGAILLGSWRRVRR